MGLQITYQIGDKLFTPPLRGNLPEEVSSQSGYTVQTIDFEDDEWINKAQTQRNEFLGFKFWTNKGKEYCLGEFRVDFDDDICYSENDIRIVALTGGFAPKDMEEQKAEDKTKSLFYINYYWF